MEGIRGVGGHISDSDDDSNAEDDGIQMHELLTLSPTVVGSMVI